MSARHLFRRGAISLTVSLSAFSPFAAHAETIRQVTEYSYDAVGRRVCTAVRMNAATFADSPSDACVLKAEGAQGPDRITKNIYDAAGQVVQVRQGVGTPLEQAYSTSVYSLNGAVTDIIDANGNRSQYVYDGFDRQIRWTFPSTTLPSSYNPSTPANALATAGSVNAADYEAYDYDANGNRTYWRRRETQSSTVRTIATTFDFLNRAATKTVSASGDSVATSYAYAYDNFGNMTSASEGGRTISSVYDALGRLTSETGPIGTVSYLYDAASRRSRLTWPSSAELRYEYDNADSVTTLKSSATATLVTYSYDDLGRRTSLSRGNGVATSYSYDPATLLLSSIGHTVGAGGASADNVTYSFLYNVAGQMTRRTISNNAYVWNGAYAVDRSYVSNGLNQYTAVGAASPTYDGRGNLKNDGATTWQYDLENRLRGTAAGASLIYDPLGRLYQTTTAAGTVTRYLYDGPNLIAEYSGANALLRRYAHSTGADEPIALFNGTSSTAEYLLSDHQGSVIAVTNSSGAVTAKLTYDEYGLPGASNAGLFQYTGQVYLSDLAIYHYKARAYSPTLGRFLQTDPIGYDDGLNWYAYVGNDPLNGTDPSGETCKSPSCQRQMMMKAGGPQMVKDYDRARKAHSDNVTGLIFGALPVSRMAGFGLKGLMSRITEGAVAKAVSGEVRVGAEITLSRSAQGEAAQHAADAIAAGHPDVLTIARPGAVANRGESIGGMAKVPGKHLDEYPPAMFAEGGKGASVRAINPRDNMSAGACIGNACRGLPDGTTVRIKVTD